jgi:hypothetical protein
MPLEHLVASPSRGGKLVHFLYCSTLVEVGLDQSTQSLCAQALEQMAQPYFLAAQHTLANPALDRD